MSQVSLGGAPTRRHSATSTAVNRIAPSVRFTKQPEHHNETPLNHRARPAFIQLPHAVFTRADAAGSVVFREGPAPTRADIADVAARVEKRMRRWLRRRGLLDEQREEDRSNEAPSQSPLEACMQLSLFGSTSLRLAKDGAAMPLAASGARLGLSSW